MTNLINRRNMLKATAQTTIAAVAGATVATVANAAALSPVATVDPLIGYWAEYQQAFEDWIAAGNARHNPSFFRNTDASRFAAETGTHYLQLLCETQATTFEGLSAQNQFSSSDLSEQWVRFWHKAGRQTLLSNIQSSTAALIASGGQPLIIEQTKPKPSMELIALVAALHKAEKDMGYGVKEPGSNALWEEMLEWKKTNPDMQELASFPNVWGKATQRMGLHGERHGSLEHARLTLETALERVKTDTDKEAARTHHRETTKAIEALYQKIVDENPIAAASEKSHAEFIAKERAREPYSRAVEACPINNLDDYRAYDAWVTPARFRAA